MKITGNKSISSMIKIFLIIMFAICIASIITVPIVIENQGSVNFKQIILNETLGTTIICIYLSGIPALVMLYQFIKIFSALEKGEIFSRKIENRFLIASICSIIIGIIYGINAIIMPSKITQFDYSAIVTYIFFAIITAMIFLILGIGLIVLKEIYKTKNSFYRLCVNAKVKEDFNDIDEQSLAGGMLRLINTDSIRLLKFWINTLENYKENKIISFNDSEEKMLLMLHYTLYTKSPKDLGINSINEFLQRLYSNKVIYEEIIEILKYNLSHIKVKTFNDNLSFDTNLEVHATYTKEQILASLGKNTIEKQYPLREGVLYIEDKKTDVFLITLNKVEKHFSPSTMYEDYAINDELFNWQSQSRTSIDSPTGKRYINHRDSGNNILLFVRENKSEDGVTSPYTYLGAADIVSHSGSKPISIVLKLRNKLPASIAVKAEKAL